MTQRLNEKFIELMDKLAAIMLKRGEPFRARAYQKAQETILLYPGDILSPNDLKGQRGIGETIMEKLNEFVSTGTLALIENEKSNPIHILADVYGIGPKKSAELVGQGITTIDKLRENVHLLNDVQKVGLYFYEDILKRIPRSEIDTYKLVFTKFFDKRDGEIEIVGSYRRGAENSGDIDVIITSKKGNVFSCFIDKLIEQRIIVSVLSRGNSKCLVIAKLTPTSVARRVDFLYTTTHEYPFAVLYFTGSKIFNTVMRHIALEKGYTMNEYGIYKLEDKKKGNLVDHVFETEKDIFDFLGLEYKEPNKRVDGRAVKPVINSSKKIMIIENEVSPFQDIANNFKKTGITVLHKLNENELSQFLRESNKSYYNDGISFLTDNEYDIVKEYVEKKYPSNPVLYEIGAPVKKNKVQLPYPLPSMNKIKQDTNALISWKANYKGPYVISCKLDGVSALYSTETEPPKLYTRGNGIIGQDISHLIPFLRLSKTKGIVIRGELIIPYALFKAKYANTYANPRNMVTGFVINKTINQAITDVHFVAYEVIKPVKPPCEQMSFLKTLDIEMVMYKTIENNLTNEVISNILLNWRYNYAYEIDGLIISNNGVYKREITNPEHAFAFKMVLCDQIAEAKVVDVLWSASKDGYLKPRVQVEPINLGGVKISYATGFNGAFIIKNKIGIGAIVELIRSGDVIPHIRKVVVPAEEPCMPQVNYKWTESRVDIMLDDLEDDSVVLKNIAGFFKGINVDGLSDGNIKRIMNAGFNSVSKIIQMTIDDFLKVDGFKEKMATKIYNGIREKLTNASLITIMASSNIFGRGFDETKIETIMSACPDILHTKNVASTSLITIKGIGPKTAEAFVAKIPAFKEFIIEAGLTDKLVYNCQPLIEQTTHHLFEKTIVMTGFRDNELQEKIKKVGGKIGSTVNNKTFVVLVRDEHVDTGKAEEARKLNIPIMNVETFKSRYL